MDDTISDGETVLSVGEADPKPFGVYPLITEQLRLGRILHGFRSGGGLRVFSFADDGIGYGEHPYAEQAMDLLEEDLAAGGRDYNDVYGKVHPHFVTGSSTPSSEVDRWVRAGNDFDVGYYPDGRFVFASSWGTEAIPRALYAQVIESRIPVCHVDERGYIFAVFPSTLPNGDKSACGRIVEPTHDECRRRGIFDPYEIKRGIWIEDDTFEGMLAKMEAELPKYWRA